MASEVDVEIQLTTFLEDVLDKTESVLKHNFDLEAAETQAEVIDQTVRLIRSLNGGCCDNERDKKTLESLAAAFENVLVPLRRRIITPTTVAVNSQQSEGERIYNRGRPSIKIPMETLEELRGIGFTWTKIAQMLGVSRWTIHRRVVEYGLDDMKGFSQLSDAELDEIF